MRGKNASSGRSHASLLDELFCPFTRMVNPVTLETMFLLRKQNNRITVNIVRIPSVMYKLPVIPDTRAGSILFWEGHSTPSLKTQVVDEPETNKTYDANDKPLHIIDGIKLFVHSGRMTGLVNFLVNKQLAVPAIFKCDFCAQLVEHIFQKTRTVELVDASTVPTVRQYRKQRLTVTKNTKFVLFLSRNEFVSHKIRSTQHVRIPPFSQFVITVQTEQENLILDAPKTPTGNQMECSAACKNQDIKRNESFRIIVASSTGKKKNISKSQGVTIAETPPTLKLATKKTAGEMLGMIENRVRQTTARSAIPRRLKY